MIFAHNSDYTKPKSFRKYFFALNFINFLTAENALIEAQARAAAGEVAANYSDKACTEKLKVIVEFFG